eukprot:scaffold9675_cov109-Isochrysis_galbana.AAC.2
MSLDWPLRPTGAWLGACTRIFGHSAQPRKHLPSRTPVFPVAASPYFQRAAQPFGASIIPRTNRYSALGVRGPSLT